MYTIVWFRRARIGVETLDANAKRPLQLEQFGALFAGEESGGNSVSAGAASSTDAVDEILRHVRQVVVDDVDDVLDVNPARSEIGRHQDAEAALLEAGKCCSFVAIASGRRESWRRRSRRGSGSW